MLATKNLSDNRILERRVVLVVWWLLLSFSIGRKFLIFLIFSSLWQTLRVVTADRQFQGDECHHIQRYGGTYRNLGFCGHREMVLPSHFQQAERYDRATSNFFNPLLRLVRHGPVYQYHGRSADSQKCIVQRKTGSNAVVADKAFRSQAA